MDPRSRVAFRKNCVICDEEYKDLCRMYAERCLEGHVAIVCAVYGLMIQSVACEEREFPRIYSKMKAELSQILDGEGDVSEKEAELCAFFDRYTTAKVYQHKLTGER